MLCRSLISIRRLLARFASAKSGVAAIEFAFIFPILALIVVALPDVSNAATGDVNMDTAVRASIQYAMNGGQSLSTIQAVGLQAWASKPQGATLTATQACLCGSGSATCGSTCANGSLANTYITVTATATLGGNMISFPKTTVQKVRIQ